MTVLWVTSQQEVRDILLFRKLKNHEQSCCCHGRKMNPCVFMKFICTNYPAFSGGKYFFSLPSNTIHGVHKSSISLQFHIWWGFPARKKEAAHYFQKAQNLIKAVVMRRKVNQCAFLKIWGCNSKASQLENIAYHKGPIPGSHNHVSWFSQSCVRHTYIHCATLYEKKGFRTLWVLADIPLVNMIRWNCSVRWLPSMK